MVENTHTVVLTKSEYNEATVLLNITLRASTDDPTFAGRFPATTGEFRAKTLNDIYYQMSGHDHLEIKKRYGSRHTKEEKRTNRLSLDPNQREFFLTEIENELANRKNPTTPYRSVLESIASKLKTR